MTETLVIHDADVDVRREFLAGDARVHGFVAVIVVSCRKELFPKVVDCPIFFREPTWCLVSVGLSGTLKKGA